MESKKHRIIILSPIAQALFCFQALQLSSIDSVFDQGHCIQNLLRFFVEAIFNMIWYGEPNFGARGYMINSSCWNLFLFFW